MTDVTLAQMAGRSTVGSLIGDCARRYPDRPAVETAGRARTYGELNDRVNRAVAMLRGFEGARGGRGASLPAGRPEAGPRVAAPRRAAGPGRGRRPRPPAPRGRLRRAARQGRAPRARDR